MQLPVLGNVRDSDVYLLGGLAIAAGAVFIFGFRGGNPPPPPPPPGQVITMIQSSAPTPATGPQGTVFRVTATVFDQSNNPVPAVQLAVLDNGAQLFVTSQFTDINGQIAVDIPNLVQGTHSIAFATLDGLVTSNAQAITVKPPLMTIAGYPWGITLQNLGHRTSVSVWLESNDIRFDIIETGIPSGDTHAYLIRTFDPSGKHVKDYVGGLSSSDPRDYDPNSGQINNITGTCSACQQRPGTWRFFIFSTDGNWPQDTTRPLEFGPYTVNTEGVVAQFIGEKTLRV